MKKISLIALLFVTAALSTSVFADGAKYKVSITNLTKSVSFTPVMVAAHSDKVSLFELGKPSSDAIGRVAEGGDTSGVAAMFDSYHDQVKSLGGLLNAGETAELVFEGISRQVKFTVASMLLPTNDAFVAQTFTLKKWKHSKTFFLNAYDSGTETNDELCVSIPGPVCGGEPFSPEDEGEGFVHVHSGIHGIADLNASQYTWNDPVLKVKITRVW